MDTNIPIWVTVPIAIISCIATYIFPFILNLFRQRREVDRDDNKQKAEQARAENEQAFAILKEVIRICKEDIARLELKLTSIEQKNDKLEADHLVCQRENAEFKVKIEKQDRIIERLTQENCLLRSKLDSLNKGLETVKKQVNGKKT